MPDFSKILKVIVSGALMFLFIVVFSFAADTQDNQEKQSSAFKKGLADYFYNQGNEHKNSGDIDKAIDSWTKALEQNPEFAEAYYNRGSAYGRQDKLDKALSDFDKTIQFSSDIKMQTLAYYNKGLIYQKKGDFGQAISNYDKAIEIDATYPPAYKNRAVVYFSMKDYDKSWDDVSKAEELGLKCHPEFLKELEKASGRNN